MLWTFRSISKINIDFVLQHWTLGTHAKRVNIMSCYEATISIKKNIFFYFVSISNWNNNENSLKSVMWLFMKFNESIRPAAISILSQITRSNDINFKLIGWWVALHLSFNFRMNWKCVSFHCIGSHNTHHLVAARCSSLSNDNNNNQIRAIFAVITDKCWAGKRDQSLYK